MAAPSSGDNVFLTQSGATDIFVEYFDPAPEAALGVLRIDATGPGLMVLQQGFNAHNLFTNSEIVGDTGTGNVFMTGGTHDVVFNLVLGDTATGNGSFSVNNTGTGLSSGNIYVGNNGTGALDILNGGAVTSVNGFIGDKAGSSGEVNVDGPGASWNNNNPIYVGNNGTGSMTIQNGGSVTNGTGAVGRLLGGNGNVLIDGAGSRWLNNAALHIGGTGTSSGGSGSVTVQNGGSLEVAGTLTVWQTGSLSLSGGTITTGSFNAATDTFDFVDGILTIDGGSYNNGLNPDLVIDSTAALANPTLEFTNGASHTVTTDTFIGREGAGSLLITNGGSVTGTFGRIGFGANATGVVTVDGAGSAWNNVRAVYVGVEGSGTLNVLNAGVVTSSDGLLGDVPSGPGAGGTVTVDGTGSAWNIGNQLSVGHAGNVNSSLGIQDGGSVNASVGFIGRDSASSGSVSVNGPGSGLAIAFDLEVGLSGTGVLDILDGGSVNSGRGIVGRTATGSGTVTVNGAGAAWANTGDLIIGNAGTGVFNIKNGATVTNRNGNIGGLAGSSGAMTVHGVLSSWDVAGVLGVGIFGTGALNIEANASVFSPDAQLGSGVGGVGVASVTGGGSQWNTNNLLVGFEGSGQLNIGSGGTVTTGNIAYIGHQVGSSGDATLGAGGRWDANLLFVGGNAQAAGGNGTLTINDGVVNAGALQVWSPGIVNLNGGSLTVNGIINEGQFNFNAGTLNINTDLNASTLTTATSLTGLKTLNVTGNTILDGFSTLTLDGGTFSTGSLFDNGGFTFNSGTFNLTGSHLIIGANGLFGHRAVFNFDQTVNVSSEVFVAPGAVLSLRGGSVSANALFNEGTIELTDTLSDLGGSSVTNRGLIQGSGEVSGFLVNEIGAVVRAGPGQMLSFTSPGNNTNGGNLNLTGGTIAFSQQLTNAAMGDIAGRGTLIVDGGLVNQGNFNLSSGNTDVFGNVNNDTGGTIILSGEGTATFFDDMAHNGAEIRVSAGSTAVFFGTVSGSGSYTGTGTVFFEGAVLPGASPAQVSVQGDLNLGIGAHTLMEIGGLVRGDQYDAFDIGGDLNILGGKLEVSLFDLGNGLFNPKLGDSFDLFSAESIDGNFDVLTLAMLGQGLGWQLDFLTDAVGTLDVARLSVVASAVPVPAAVWLFGSGMIGLIAVAHRRPGRRQDQTGRI